MKKLIVMLLVLLLWMPAFAEEAQRPALPVKIIGQEAAVVSMTEAVATAHQFIDMTLLSGKRAEFFHAELVELADGKLAWVVTTFDTSNLMYAWTAMVDAANGDVLYIEASNDGYLPYVLEAWTEAKGPQALWSLEDKQLYDALYALMPAYGLPMPGDLSAEVALKKALAALGMDDAGGYSVGYGYLMGGEGYNGVWEIYLVVDGQVDCQVNLDAVTGEVYYLERNQVEPDGANG